MEWDLDGALQVDYMYAEHRLLPFRTEQSHLKPAFYGIIDLLAILPYYIEIMLRQDTVHMVLAFMCCQVITVHRSRFFSGFQSYVCSDCYAFFGPSVTIIPFYCELIWDFNLNRTNIFGRTIEVMYISIRRSQHALLAIGFFALFVVIFFSTLL
jgi:potassium voltage-gated channel Shal-related subfamily D protein 2